MNLYYVLFIINILYAQQCTDKCFIEFKDIIFYGMVGHSLISAALFFIAGHSYDVSHNKNLANISSTLSPVTLTLFFIFILANSAFPFCILFVFESMAFSNMVYLHHLLCYLLLALSFLNLISGLYLYYKYFISAPLYSIIVDTHYFDFLLILLLVPILLLTITTGFSALLPLHYLSASYGSILSLLHHS